MFLEQLMPDKGLYCVALLIPEYGSFRHFFHKSLDAASSRIEALDRAGHNVYLAQATFDPTKIEAAKEYNANRVNGDARAKERSQANAMWLKNFFLDIDCGEKWPLKNQKEGCQALKQFVSDTGLPMPTVVNSGNGLYAHWVLTQSVPAHQWQTVAKVLKKVVATYSPAIGGDSSRTSDSASVLRPPGTVNRKPGKAEKPVNIIHQAGEVDFLLFAKLLGIAARKRKIDRTALMPPQPVADINAEFLIQHDSIPSDPEQVADRCAQLGLMRDLRGDVPEPLWYSCLGLLAFCEGGEEKAQEWSSGYDDYDYGQTERKLKQWSDQGVGPTTCAKFGEVNPDQCIGCPNIGKIKSPIVLGRPDPEEKVIEETQIAPPQGFRRAEDGLFVETDGRWTKFYDQDLWLHQLAFDESLGYEVMTIRHMLPFEGEMEFTLRSSLIMDPKALMTALVDNHVKVLGTNERKLMVAYIEGYQQQLQRQRRMIKLLCSMGWKKEGNNSVFVVGKKIFHSDGSVDDASLAKNVPNAVKGFRSDGDLSKWTQAISVLGKPKMEPFAFAFCAGAFGAPLMGHTGFDGALVSMWGDSGAGKTLLLRMIHSVWGYHKDLIMLRDDTKNVTVARLGVYNSLPLTIDEITNIGGMEASDFVYRITQGRDKARLNKDSVERAVLNRWNTLAVTTSNSSLIDLLTGTKQDASAELNRVLEYHISEHPIFQGGLATETFWAIDENYGLAGEAYASWLVQNEDKIKPALDLMRKKIEKEAELRGDERYWGAIVSVGIVGGLFAKQLGLINLDMGAIYKWAINLLKSLRSIKSDLTGTAVDALGQFLSDHASNRLIVMALYGRNTKCQVLDEPRGPLVYRMELTTQALFISKMAMKSWLAKRHGSLTKMEKELTENGVLINNNYRKALGAGTNIASAQQPCWRIDLMAPALGPVGDEIRDNLRLLDENVNSLF